MVRQVQEHFLLIGDSLHEVEGALMKAIPDATITRAENVFQAITDQIGNKFTAVVVNAEPMERRPEAAVKTLRELAGNGRVILFGQAPFEPLARKMLQYGCDDYVISPPTPSDIKSVLGSSNLRITAETRSPEISTEIEPDDDAIPVATVVSKSIPAEVSEPKTSPDIAPVYVTSDITAAFERMQKLTAGDLAQIVLDEMIAHPTKGVTKAINAINALIAPAAQLLYQSNEKRNSACIEAENTNISDQPVELQHPIESSDQVIGQMQLVMNEDITGVTDTGESAAFLQIARQAISRAHSLQDRYNKLYQLAITDQLTGVYNRRHFENFLNSILDRAKSLRFQVTLLLFDIDNFKKYNDECGHAMGDEILKETANLMKRCTREHDLVARIGGDEFAVVFWEKELPRQPKNPATPIQTARVPQEPLTILQRFRKLIANKEFSGLGSSGKGTLTISGGLASFPWDGRTAKELIDAADRALIFGAKKSGKNSIYLVGDGQSIGDES